MLFFKETFRLNRLILAMDQRLAKITRKGTGVPAGETRQPRRRPLSYLRGAALRLGPALGLLAAAISANAQAPPPDFDPVKWSFALDPAEAAPGNPILGRLSATIELGWRLYAPSNPSGGGLQGPPATKIELLGSPAVASWKALQPEPITKFDPVFDTDSEIYLDETVFLFEIELAKDAPLGEATLEATAFYSACDDRFCLRPVRRRASAPLRVVSVAEGAVPEVPSGYMEAKPAPATRVSESPVGNPAGAVVPAGSEGFLQFAAVAFGFGILAIFTPCVFPMIPITMSYFVSTQTGSRRASVIQATIFCAGVIVLFTGLGAIVSAILGPFGTVQLGSNVWVNLFIALIFIVFAASLFGAFEITVPSGAMTRLNEVSGRGGILGTLVMGLVFALASFACTGPFVGALLAGSIQGDLTWPIFGMAMFSSGMALPFFGLALFPAYLSKLPKSGGWLGRTKRTLAFLILAAAFKYLSNVDMIYQYEILLRERFLAIWIVLLVLAGLYSLGLLRFPDEEEEPAGLGRLALGATFLIVAISLVPGMFGGRLGELDAYVPPPEYSGFTAGFASSQGGAQVSWLKDDYEQALAMGRESGKPVLVSFTGYTCTNCHWMKSNMFTKPEIVELTRDMILVELYTDGPSEIAAAHQQLQLSRFHTTAIPYYAIIRPDESVAATFPGRTRDVEEFRRFLASGG